MINSFTIILTSTFLSVIVSIFAGYTLQRFVFRGKRLFGNFLITAQMFPGVLFLLPIYLMFIFLQTNFGIQLVGTHVGVILTYMTFALPFSIWMMKSYFESIPRELEEAAHIDGCSQIGIIFRIIIPVSLPGVIAVVIYSFLLGWEEVLFASILTDSETRTIAVGLRNYASTTSTYWNEMMAAAVTVTLPVVVIFLLLQKYLISGLTEGGVKG
ncbi:carbohydrate ABC transporter permease [Paenibacillus sp. PL2-23]|uniref:carbohydrate ABC transporter permease n=1 Tax=Paenibacillus sp. PL2-23 TaxID=2100729 RepID=UPI0030F7C721